MQNMLELSRRVEGNDWIRDASVVGGSLGSWVPAGNGQARAELTGRGLSLETSIDYRQLAGDPGLGLPSSVVSGCSAVAALAPRVEGGAVNVGVQLRAGATSADHRCSRGRFVMGGGLRLETPVADRRVALVANGAVTGRGSPLNGSPTTRRANRHLELGVEVDREIPGGNERVALVAFRSHDREELSEHLRGRRATGVAFQYERGFTVPNGPGSTLQATLVGEGRVARVDTARLPVEATALVRLRLAY